MANNPKKLTDPTDEALTAIQQVLSVSDEPTDRRTETRRRPPDRRRRTEPTRPASPPRHRPAPARRNRPVRRPAPAHDDVRPSQYAANDDRQSIGQILRTLQQRPAKTSYVVATAVCARLGGLRRGARLPLSARPAVGAEARPGRHPGHGRPCRLRAGADRVLLRDGLHDVALAGDAHHRPVDGECRHEACRAGRGRPRIPS